MSFGLDIKSFDSSRYQEIIDALRKGRLVFQETEPRKDFIIDYPENSGDEGRIVAAGYLNTYNGEIVVQIFLRNYNPKSSRGSKSLKEVIDGL